jgi:hypothetical protein
VPDAAAVALRRPDLDGSASTPSRLPSPGGGAPPLSKRDGPSRIPAAPAVARGVASEDRVRVSLECVNEEEGAKLLESLGFVRREGGGAVVMRRGNGLSVELLPVKKLGSVVPLVLFSKHVETLQARMVLAGWRQTEDSFDSPVLGARLTIEFEI